MLILFLAIVIFFHSLYHQLLLHFNQHFISLISNPPLQMFLSLLFSFYPCFSGFFFFFPCSVCLSSNSFCLLSALGNKVDIYTSANHSGRLGNVSSQSENSQSSVWIFVFVRSDCNVVLGSFLILVSTINANLLLFPSNPLEETMKLHQTLR